jgi:uncharacterized Zn finger protein
MIRPCPQCGCETTVVKAQARGPVEFYYNAHGREDDILDYKLWFDRSKIVRCAGCGELRRDLEVVCYERMIAGERIPERSRIKERHVECG